MAFRDWLTSDGVAMPLYPWLSSVGDKFIEHGHRVLGMAAGALSIAVVIACHVAGERPAVKRYAWALLVGVIAQGALGGLRVVLDARVVALIHGATGPLFFAAAAGFVVVTSAKWRETKPVAKPTPADRRLTRLAVLCAGLTYAQLLLGVVVRHSALMIRDSSASLFEAATYLHVLTAVAAVAYLMMLLYRSFRAGALQRLTTTIGLLIVLQFTLGLATWWVKYGIPAWATSWVGEFDFVNREAAAVRALIVTGHGAIGALLVALTFVAAMWAAHRTGGLERLKLPAISTGGRVLA